MKLKHFLAAGAAALLLNSANAQPRIDADSAKKTAAASYWQKNPAALFKYSSPARYELGILHKFHFGELKAVAAKEHKNEGLGIYYENLFGGNRVKKFFGAGIERIKNKTSSTMAEMHSVLPVKGHNIFTGYANTSGRSALTAGDFFNYKKLHFGVVVAARSGDSAERLQKKHTEALFFGVEGRYKGLLRFDGANASYTGFLRFGESEFQRTFTPDAFYLDRKNLAQQMFRRVRNEDFNAPLPNTHPSEMGRLVVVTRYSRTGEKNDETLEVYATKNSGTYPIIFGFGGQRKDAGIKVTYSANAYAGTSLGPFRVIGSFGSNNGIYLSCVKKK